jgi:hypothetical protein
MYNLVIFSFICIDRRYGLCFLQLQLDCRFHWSVTELMLSSDTRGHKFQFSVALTPGTETVLSPFRTLLNSLQMSQCNRFKLDNLVVTDSAVTPSVTGKEWAT